MAQLETMLSKEQYHAKLTSVLIVWGRGGFHRSMSRFSSHRSVQQEELFTSFVRSRFRYNVI